MTIKPLTCMFKADGKTHTFTWHAGREMWAINVETKDGGATHWWATPQEMTQWVIGRRYMSLWAQAHFEASELRARAIAEAAYAESQA